MTDRDEQFEQLTAYLDGELTETERAEVETLLERDPAARRLLNELRQTAALVAGLPRASAPADFSQSVVARLERDALLSDATVSGRGWTLGNWSALAASIVLVAAAGWYALPHVNQLRPESMATNGERTMHDGAASPAEEHVAIFSDSDRASEGIRRGSVRKATEVRRHDDVAASRQPNPALHDAAASPAVEKKREVSMLPAPDSQAPERLAIGSLHIENCVAVSEAAEVDQSLNEGRLTPDALVNATEDAFTNRILVEVPNDSAVPLLGQVVEENLAGNSVANLEREPKDKPIDRGRAFYSNRAQAHPAPTRARPEAGSTADGNADDDALPVCQIVFSVPREQATELITAMQNTCVANGYDANYDVNGRQFGNFTDPVVVTGNLVSVVDDADAIRNLMDDETRLAMRVGDHDAEVTTLAEGAWHGDDVNDADNRNRRKHDKKVEQPSTHEPTETAGEDKGERSDAEQPKGKAPPTTRGQDDAKAEADRSGGRGRGASARKPGEVRPSEASSSGEGRAAIASAQPAAPRARGTATREMPSRESRDEAFVGPLAPAEFDDADLVTCVVTIRPAMADRRGSRGATIGSMREVGRTDDAATTTSGPASTQPAKGDSGG